MAIGAPLTLLFGYAGSLTIAANAHAESTIWKLAYLGGALWYFGAPLVWAAAVAVTISEGAKWAKCRSPMRARLASLLVGIALVTAQWFLAPWYVAMGFAAAGTLPSEERILAVAFHGLALYGLASIIIMILYPSFLVKRQKFCEVCENYAKDKVVCYVPFTHLRQLLLALYENRPIEASDIERLSAGEGPPKQGSHAEVMLGVCKCDSSSLVEVRVTALATTDSGKEFITQKRLVFSSRAGREVCRVLAGEG